MAKLAAIGLVLVVAGVSPPVVARIQTGASPGGAVSAFGAVWVANDGAGTVVRIDPGTNRVTRSVKLRPGLFSVARGFGAVWAVNYKRDSLTRVDPASGRTRSVRVGASPFDVLCAFGRVWVTSWEAGLLTELEPRTLRVVRRIEVGPRPTGLRARRRGASPRGSRSVEPSPRGRSRLTERSGSRTRKRAVSTGSTRQRGESSTPSTRARGRSLRSARSARCESRATRATTSGASRREQPQKALVSGRRRSSK